VEIDDLRDGVFGAKFASDDVEVFVSAVFGGPFDVSAAVICAPGAGIDGHAVDGGIHAKVGTNVEAARWSVDCYIVAGFTVDGSDVHGSCEYRASEPEAEKNEQRCAEKAGDDAAVAG